MSKPMINKDITVSGTSYTLEDLCKKIDSLNTSITNLTNTLSNYSKRLDYAQCQFDRASYSFTPWARTKITTLGELTGNGDSLLANSNGTISVLKDGVYLVLGQITKNCVYLGDVVVEVVMLSSNGSETNRAMGYHHASNEDYWTHVSCFGVYSLKAGQSAYLSCTSGAQAETAELLDRSTMLTLIRLK